MDKEKKNATVSQFKIHAFLWRKVQVTNYNFYLVEVVFFGGECLSYWFFWIKLGFAATTEKVVTGVRQAEMNNK